MQRRSFLKYSGISLASLVVIIFGIGAYKAKSYIQRVISNNLPYISAKEDDLSKFTADYIKFAPQPLLNTLNSVSLFSLFYALYAYLGFRTDKSALDQHISKVFLLSTDFFKHQNKDVSYIAFYDPHRFACQNPFATFE